MQRDDMTVPFRAARARHDQGDLIISIPTSFLAGSDDEIVDPSWYSTD